MNSIFEIRNCSCVEQNVDVIVNAANRNLISGGGICGAIYKKAGYSNLNEVCRKIKTPLKDGDAVLTPAFNIKNAKYIIHAVGPNFSYTPNAFNELFNAYYNSLLLVKDNNLHSIAFPLISAGIYGGHLENPAAVSTKQCIMAYNKFDENFPDYNIHVILCAYTKEEFDSAIKIKNNEKNIKSKKYLMNKINYHKITIDEFLKLDENDLMLVTNPGRIGDEDGSYFIMKDNDKFVAYRISGWMYGQKENNSVSFDMMCSHFPKWKEAWKNYAKEDYDGKYKFVYMGFGNGLCIDKRVYEEFNKFLERVVSQDPRYKSEEKIPALYYNSWKKALFLYVNEKNIELV